MDHSTLTKQSWAFGLLIASLQMFLVVMICYVRFVVELFRRRERVMGILFTALFLFVGGGWTIGVLTGLPVGWARASEWQIRGWMLLWSFALLVALINLALGFWLGQMSAEQWKNWFSWAPPF